MQKTISKVGKLLWDYFTLQEIDKKKGKTVRPFSLTEDWFKILLFLQISYRAEKQYATLPLP